MERILHCAACGRRFVAVRKDATTCSARCRKKLSRTMAVVTDDVTVPAPVTTQVSTGWLPLAAVPPAPEPVTAPKVRVPTPVDVYGCPSEFIEVDEAVADQYNALIWRKL